MSDSETRPDLIEGLIAERTVNLIGGPSGSGKTTWVLELLSKIKNGQSILGREVRSVPCAYWCADRGSADVAEVLARIGVAQDDVLVFSDLDDGTQIFDIPNRLPAGIQLVVIDPITVYTQNGRLNDYAEVGKWLRQVRSLCKLHGLTIIGIAHTSKVKGRDTYANPRQRLLGSVAWASFADTLILIEPAKPNKIEDTSRIVYVMPRHEPATQHRFTVEVQTGKLIEVPTLDHLKLAVLLPAEFERGEAVRIGDSLGISMRTLDRWLSKMVQDGQLQKLEHGRYTKLQIAVEGIILPSARS